VCPRTEADFACDNDQDYEMCLGVIKRDLVTATAAIAALTSVCPPEGRRAWWRLTVRGG